MEPDSTMDDLLRTVRREFQGKLEEGRAGYNRSVAQGREEYQDALSRQRAGYQAELARKRQGFQEALNTGR